MARTCWGEDKGPNFKLWDELYWVIAQGVCQQRALTQPPEDAEHIEDPATDNHPCDWCYNATFTVVNDGLLDLLEAYGSVAYSCGTSCVPEREAARRALSAMIERAREIERTKELLAQVAGKNGWRRFPPEDDERKGSPS